MHSPTPPAVTLVDGTNGRCSVGRAVARAVAGSEAIAR